jgi:hypothetical protein
MTTLCKWLALGQGECQKFVPGEHLARRDMLILCSGERTLGHHARWPRSGMDMLSGCGLPGRTCPLLALGDGPAQRFRAAPWDMPNLCCGERTPGHHAHRPHWPVDMSSRARADHQMPRLCGGVEMWASCPLLRSAMGMLSGCRLPGRTCSILAAARGHLGLLPSARGQRWTCPTVAGFTGGHAHS